MILVSQFNCKLDRNEKRVWSVSEYFLSFFFFLRITQPWSWGVSVQLVLLIGFTRADIIIINSYLKNYSQVFLSFRGTETIIEKLSAGSHWLQVIINLRLLRFGRKRTVKVISSSLARAITAVKHRRLPLPKSEEEEKLWSEIGISETRIPRHWLQVYPRYQSVSPWLGSLQWRLKYRGHKNQQKRHLRNYTQEARFRGQGISTAKNG